MRKQVGAVTGADRGAVTRAYLYIRVAMRWRDEHGAGSVLAVAFVAVLVGILSLLGPLASAYAAKHRAGHAADAAALAAADVARGIAPGHPCETAAALAAAHGGALSGCLQEGFVVTVRVSVPVLGLAVLPLPAHAVATAGPPG
ncbi:Rv3654c family TadE-like protein [Ruicaihuangia caeni]|uniref:Rv3654c family TadE-like protein n=1 Tax=Ruicaihuangia caeni TaxID=3042517 RepID=UPI00338F4AF2